MRRLPNLGPLGFSLIYFSVCSLLLARVVSSNLITTAWMFLPILCMQFACGMLAIWALESLVCKRSSEVEVNEVFNADEKRLIRMIGLVLPFTVVAVTCICPFTINRGFEIEKSLLFRSFDPLARVSPDMRTTMLDFAKTVTDHLLVDRNSEQYPATELMLKDEVSRALLKKIELGNLLPKGLWKVDSTRIEGVTNDGYVMVRVRLVRDEVKDSLEPASTCVLYKIGVRTKTKIPALVEIQLSLD